MIVLSTSVGRPQLRDRCNDLYATPPEFAGDAMVERSTIVVSGCLPRAAPDPERRTFGMHSQRYSLSSANRFRGSSHDIDPFGREDAPLVFEVKARKMTGK